MAANSALAIDQITAKGQYLFYSNGTQFFIRGVAYQQGVGVGGQAETTTSTFVDPLANSTTCTRDIAQLKKLGTNTIRVYAVDPTKDHEACMSALSDAGIYVIADLSAPDDGDSINRDSPSWNTALYARYTAVIDNLAQYDNTLGFFAGNEVTNNKTNSGASAFVKAAVRDSKAYITSKNYGRWLGVGYATNDDADTRDLLADYFNCGETADSVDFWGYNIYEWCGESTFKSSGYEERTEAFANYSVPAFFSEYGCNNPGGGAARVWQETGVLYSTEMTSVWSGGIVYEYFQEQNDYGLVNVSGTTVTPRADFTALEKQIAASGYPKSSDVKSKSSYTATNTARDCPAVKVGTWNAASTLPPTPNSTVCACMFSGLSCTVSSSVTTKEIGTLFGTVCGLDSSACDGIAANATTGTYGIYSMCNSTQQMAYVLNQYYLNQDSASTACDFDGQATLVSQKAASTCSAILSAASASATSSSSSTSDSKSAAPAIRLGPIENLPFAGSIVAAAIVGMVMILL